MKILLTGATGFVGAEVLSQLAINSSISGITCLSRRPIGLESPKVKTIIHSDFAVYDDGLLSELAGHSSCIWALGGKASDLGDALMRITHTFTLALAAGIAARSDRRFTFCYLSGMGADPSERAWLPWEKETRHLKGRTEKDLLALQTAHPDFCVHNFRPAASCRAIRTLCWRRCWDRLS
jgi:nucleoside-diphosphate-sugar epimerase